MIFQVNIIDESSKKIDNSDLKNILNVSFSKCEDDYKNEPVYCPYFHLAKATIKNSDDAQWAKRYFIEYFTSNNDPDLPFYRAVDVFKCEVTVKE